MRFKIKIQQKVLFLFLILSIIPILSLFLLSHNLESKITSNKLAYLSDNANMLGSRIEGFMHDRTSDIKLLSKNTIITSNASTKDKLNEINKIIDIHHYYEDICIIDLDGSLILSTNPDFNMDLKNNPFFLDALSGKIIVSDAIFFNKSNEVLFLILAPVYDYSNNLVSIVAAHVNINDMFESFESFSFGQTGYYELINYDGYYIYHPDNGYLFKKTSHDIGCQYQNTLEADYDGDNVVNANYPILSDLIYNGNGCWQVYASQDEQEIFSNLYSIKRFIYGLILATIIFSIGGSLFFSKTLSKPITKLTDAAREITSGDLSVRSNVKTNDEIGELSTDFDQMVEMFIRIHEELSQKNLDLLELDKSKDNFLAVVSHELRTPLTSIRSFSQLMYDGILGTVTKKQKEGLKVIISSEDNLARLINDILDYSRLKAGKDSLNITLSNINNIVKNSISEFNAQLKRIDGSIKVKFNNKIKLINVDEDKIVQIIRNLVSNSIKYRSKNKLAIVLTIDENKHYLKFIVSDNGIGIEKKNIDKIFDKFYQVDQTMTRFGEGTGLGLSITKHLVELHKGKIEVESKINAGTAVTVYISKHLQ